MKKFLTAGFLVLAVPLLAGAQILNPVKWKYSAQRIGEGQYIVHVTALIDPGWHIYAQDAGEGPVPTQVTFEKAAGTTFKGKVREVGKLEKQYDKNFQSVLKFYEKKVDFVQYVQSTGKAGQVKGTVEYMVCDNHQCLPPKDISFTVQL